MTCKLCEGKNQECSCNSVKQMVEKIDCCIHMCEDKLFECAPESLLRVYFRLAKNSKTSKEQAQKFMIECIEAFYRENANG